MYLKTKLKHSSLRTMILIPALITTCITGTASAANGTHPDGHGGTVCKGAGPCLVLELDCKGTYTDATDHNGTVYGKCSKRTKNTYGLKQK
jgi:hypothetical protein